jgi:hypothetical protein
MIAWVIVGRCTLKHFGEQILGDRHDIVVAAVTHHEQPAGQPILEAVPSVTSDRHQHLLEKGLNTSEHETAEGVWT